MGKVQITATSELRQSKASQPVWFGPLSLSRTAQQTAVNIITSLPCPARLFSESSSSRSSVAAAFPRAPLQ